MVSITKVSYFLKRLISPGTAQTWSTKTKVKYIEMPCSGCTYPRIFASLNLWQRITRSIWQPSIFMITFYLS